jgi:hypothetical protein
LLFYKEDVAAVVTVRKTKTGERLLEINGKSVAGTAYEYENTQKDAGASAPFAFWEPQKRFAGGVRFRGLSLRHFPTPEHQ